MFVIIFFFCNQYSPPEGKSTVKTLPFEFVVGTSRECGGLEYLAHLLTAEAEVVDCPHIAELHHLHLNKSVDTKHKYYQHIQEKNKFYFSLNRMENLRFLPNL